MSRTELNRIMKIVDSNDELLENDYHVKKLGVFGSVARGNQKKSSDVDILVEFSKPVGFFQFIKLEDYLSKILSRKVDLVTKNALKPAIKAQILKEMIYYG